MTMCMTGFRSEQARQFLKRNGFERVEMARFDEYLAKGHPPCRSIIGEVVASRNAKIAKTAKDRFLCELNRLCASLNHRRTSYNSRTYARISHRFSADRRHHQHESTAHGGARRREGHARRVRRRTSDAHQPRLRVAHRRRRQSQRERRRLVPEAGRDRLAHRRCRWCGSRASRSSSGTCSIS